MSELKVEWVFVQDMFQQNPCIDRECDPRITVPVVRLDELRVWLEAHKYPLQYRATEHNGVIDDLLAELKDKP